MAVKQLTMLLVALCLSFALPSGAVDKSYFIGNWVNVNEQTGGIRAMQIGQQDEQFVMRAWGACHPILCKWGLTKVSFLAPGGSSKDATAATAVFTTNFKEPHLTMRPGANGTLMVEVIVHFTDKSGRSDYTKSEIFRSASGEEWDSNIFN